MKVTVNRNHCQGHTMCNMAASEVFKLDEDGNAYVESSEVPAELHAKAQAGAAACPERAIVIEEQTRP
ncbi:ferredoxin [Arthrobacter sp. EPSL27]|uniref:ferredoxin n=1 Tax=Arthrobacter sp. EPSL27 TaxID=1745378 RepID=UPI0009EA3E66|nr:ferredoxin [Arthrobacter sp. EPSL27]